MSDLIKRLKACGKAWDDFGYQPDAEVCYEAAEHIKELEAKLERITSLSQKWRKEGIPVTGTRLVLISVFDVCDQLEKALKEGNDE